MSEVGYVSDVELGQKYLEERSGIEGTATAISFYEFGCKRVTLEHFNESKGEIQKYTFDAPRLKHVDTGLVPEVTKTGGPDRPMPRRGIR